VPMLPAPPRQITGPPMPGEAAVAQPDTTIPLPNQSPQGQQGGRVRVGNVTPKIAPGNPIQGAPIEPGPVMGPLGRSVVGGLAGARRGIPGIVAGAAPGAVDLGAYIAKNLHLR
jgi:hypothetical protein